MPLSLRSIGHDVGLLLHLPGIMAGLSLVVVAAAQEWFTLPGFLLVLGLSFGCGQLLYRAGFPDGQSEAQPMIVVALAWLLIACLGAIPFYLAALFGSSLNETTQAYSHPLNALFESMSGFTSTGLSMAQDASRLPASLQWWRTLSEWVGGVGVIVLALALIEPHEENYALYTAEARSRKIGDTITQTAQRIWTVFLIYTIVAMGLFALAGMSWWEALNHGMTGIATGGFTITANSFEDYGLSIKITAIIIMLLGAVSFQIHHKFLTQGNIHFALQQSQFWAFVVLFTGGFLLLWLLWLSPGFEIPAVDVIFQWASALGTCGFSSVQLAQWNLPVLLLLSIGMTVGGMAGSTTGGLKLDRIAWLAKGLWWRLRNVWLEDGQTEQFFYDGRQRDDREAVRHVGSAALIAALWLSVLGCGTFVLLVLLGDTHSLSEVLFEAASALGSVGLSVGITNPDLHWGGKLTLIVLMWMGRLELLAVLVLLSSPIVRGRLAVTSAGGTKERT